MSLWTDGQFSVYQGVTGNIDLERNRNVSPPAMSHVLQYFKIIQYVGF